MDWKDEDERGWSFEHRPNNLNCPTPEDPLIAAAMAEASEAMGDMLHDLHVALDNMGMCVHGLVLVHEMHMENWSQTGVLGHPADDDQIGELLDKARARVHQATRPQG